MTRCLTFGPCPSDQTNQAGRQVSEVNTEVGRQGREVNRQPPSMSQRPCKDPTLFHLNKCSGRYSAWVRRPNDDNKRHYIGCYTTFHMAARAQDRATLKINANTPVNFKPSDYQDDSELRATLGEKAFLKMLRDEARPLYNVVEEKSLCYAKFQRMEDHIEELRSVTKFTIREFVAHLATNPSPIPEVNEAAEILVELFGTPTRPPRDPAPGTDHGVVAAGTSHGRLSKLVNNVLELDIPKGKRSPRTRGEDLDDRPQTRAYCKRKLEMMPPCSYRRPRS